MNQGSGTRAAAGILLEAVLVSLLGYLLVGKEIFVFRHPAFSYLVLSLTVVGAFNVLLYRGKTEFAYLVLFVTALLAATWFWNRTYASTFRGLGRFWLVVVAALGGFFLLGGRRLKALRFGGTVVWIPLGLGFYIVMVLMDMYLFRLYPASELALWRAYLLNAARLGGTLGAGIGIGYDLGRLFSPGAPGESSGTNSTVPPPLP